MTTDKNKVIVLLSGGVDSTTALYQAHKEQSVIAAISFNYGSKHNLNEIKCAKFHCDKLGIKHEIIELDFINRLFKASLLKSGDAIPDGHYEEENMKQTVVPFRNGIMLSIAAGYAESIEAEGVVIAAHSGDHAIYPDCREEFMRNMSDAIQSGTYAGIEIVRPFIDMNKSQIVTIGNELGIDYSKTWSCYKGGDLQCGKCGTCVERIEAFKLSGITDLTQYEPVNE